MMIDPTKTMIPEDPVTPGEIIRALPQLNVDVLPVGSDSTGASVARGRPTAPEAVGKALMDLIRVHRNADANQVPQRTVPGWREADPDGQVLAMDRELLVAALTAALERTSFRTDLSRAKMLGDGTASAKPLDTERYASGLIAAAESDYPGMFGAPGDGIRVTASRLQLAIARVRDETLPAETCTDAEYATALMEALTGMPQWTEAPPEPGKPGPGVYLPSWTVVRNQIYAWLRNNPVTLDGGDRRMAGQPYRLAVALADYAFTPRPADLPGPGPDDAADGKLSPEARLLEESIRSGDPLKVDEDEVPAVTPQSVIDTARDGMEDLPPAGRRQVVLTLADDVMRHRDQEDAGRYLIPSADAMAAAEVSAMAGVAEALAGLSEAEAGRVIAWARARFLYGTEVTR
jgi:hypothetical protein